MIDDKELNVFKTIFNNAIFWLVLLAEMGLTHFMLFLGKSNFGTAILGVTEMTLVQYIICWVLALLSLPLNIVAKKFIPMKKFEDLNEKVNLEP